MKTYSIISGNQAAMTAICLSAVMFGLEISSIPVILPDLEKQLQGNFIDLQWVVNIYTIACSAVLMATGTLSDKYGRKRIFIISVVLFGLSSLFCGISHSVTMLIFFRFIQGMSGGAMLICQITTLSQQFSEGVQRAKGFGYWGIAFGGGLGFGPLIGGVITSVLGWQWVFLIHVFISAVTVLFILYGIEQVKTQDLHKLDITGVLSLSFSVLFLSYYIMEGSEIGFTDIKLIAVLLLFFLCLGIFLLSSKRVHNPVIDFSLFRNMKFTGAIVGAIGMNMSFWPFMIYLPIYFQRVLGNDSLTTGILLLAYSLPTLLFPPLGERLLLRFWAEKVIPSGLLVIGTGFILMWCGSNISGASWLTMLPGLMISGIGIGITNSPVANTSTGSVEVSKMGMASGIDMTFRMITLAINIALMGFILVAGVAYKISSFAAMFSDNTSFRDLAQNIISGRITETSGVIQQALVFGYSAVMLYGSISVFIMGMISFLVFRRKSNNPLLK